MDRGNANLAVATRYFSGAEQDALERQVTPLAADWQQQRIRLTERGLAELRGFDRAEMTSSQRVSAALLEWQLETTAAATPFLDYVYPLKQFAGASAWLET